MRFPKLNDGIKCPTVRILYWAQDYAGTNYNVPQPDNESEGTEADV